MIPNLILFALGALSLAVCSGYNRPIWMDETAEFAMGAFHSTAEAWKAFLGTAGGMNHGQTGAYYILGNWLMRLFGASVFWLRMPAMLFSAYLFLVAVHMLRQLKVPLRWQALAILGLASQRWISDYVAESRPYMMLAACTVGAFAYYLTPLKERSKPLARFIGWVAIIAGGLFHPYFAIYWVFAAAFGYFYRLEKKPKSPVKFIRDFTRFCNPVLLVAGSLCYFGIGYPTWLSHPVPKFPLTDPFQWLPKQFSVPRHLYAQHFLFLKMFKIPFAIAIVTFTAVKKIRRELLAVQALVAGSLLYSGLLSYLSYRNGYWILERQWIASIALTTIAAIWFIYLVSTVVPRKYVQGFGVAAVVLISAGFASESYRMVKKMVAFHEHPPDVSGITIKTKVEQIPGNGSFVKIAIANINQGGPVWPELRKLFVSE